MEGFKARDIGLRAQKKILSRMATKNVAKVFIDDTSASILDNVYKLAKTYVSIFFFLRKNGLRKGLNYLLSFVFVPDWE